jgi:hypothetical protein
MTMIVDESEGAVIDFARSLLRLSPPHPPRLK